MAGHQPVRGVAVVLVTNAPRPAADVIVQLDRFGLPHSAYDRVVTSGDTLWAIAAEAGVSLDALLTANELARDAIIYPGQSLALPGTVASSARFTRPARIAQRPSTLRGS